MSLIMRMTLITATTIYAELIILKFVVQIETQMIDSLNNWYLIYLIDNLQSIVHWFISYKGYLFSNFFQFLLRT